MIRRCSPTSCRAAIDFLHAKLLVTDQGSIVGSNNYVQKSVTYGTAEIALYSTDKQFGRSALVALERCLG